MSRSVVRCLAAVAAAVVDHPEHPAGRAVGLDGHDLFDQAAEILTSTRSLAQSVTKGASRRRRKTGVAAGNRGLRPAAESRGSYGRSRVTV
jgi:hypothetical protein